MSSRYMKIKEDSRFQRRKIEDDTKNCPAGGEDGKANVIYLLLSPSVFFYLRRKWNFRNLSNMIVRKNTLWEKVRVLIAISTCTYCRKYVYLSP